MRRVWLVRPLPRCGYAASSWSMFFFFSSRRRHTRFKCDWSSDVCSSDLIAQVLGDEEVNGLRLSNLKTGEESTLPVQGLFLAIGHKPNTDLFKGVIDTDKAGYIVPSEFTTTNIPGVFAAGDVTYHRYRQAVTAAGDGCRAAIDVERWLEAQAEA